MPTIGEFIFALGFGKPDTSNLSKAERESREAADKVAKQWKDAGRAIGKAFAVLGVASVGAAAGVFKLAENTAAAGDEIAKTSKGLGVAANELQRLRFAAERSGGTAQGMTRALRTMTVGLQDAVTKGTGPVAEGLDAIGLSAADLEDRGIEQQFSIIADALGQVDDASKRSAISMKLFGSRGGAALAPLLNEGPEGIRALGDEAERLGLIMGGDALVASEQFADDLLDFKGVITGVAREVGSALLPQISKWLAQSREWILQNRELLRQKLREFLERLVHALRELAAAATAVVEFGTDLVDMMGGVENAAKVATVAFIAFKASILGLPGVVAGVSFAVGAAVGDMIFGLEEANERLRRIRKERAAIEGKRVEVRESTEAIKQLGALISETTSGEGLRKIAAIPQSQFDGMIEKVQASADSDRLIARALSDRAIGRRLLEREKFANRGFAAQKAQDTAIRTKRPRGGGKAKAPDIGEAELLGEEEFGDEVRALAARNDASELAISAALRAGGESLNTGANRSVARQQALGRLGGFVGKDFTTPSSDPLLSHLLGEDVPDIELSAIARGAQPQTLISEINNTFHFDVDQQIDGEGDPRATGNAAVVALREVFEGAVERSTKTAKVVFAR